MQGDAFDAFVPLPLPPKPAVRVEQALLDEAARSVRRLDGLTALLPDTSLFVYSFVRKEALMSSQIEGTQSSLADLLLFETKQAPGVPVGDVREVSDYVAALDEGMAALRSGQRVSVALVRRLHRTLLRSGRDKSPGQFRRKQVWIGGSRPSLARFVPPPAADVAPCMKELDRFLRSSPLPVLTKIALAHAQLETIHPFRDGNGRIGRLLVSLLLCEGKLLSEPLLYASLYLKEHRREYYDALQRTRTHGDWEAWLRFFLTGVVESSAQALTTAQRMLALFEQNRGQILTGRGAAATLAVFEQLKKHPIASVRRLEEAVGLTYPTVAAALERMEGLGFVRELTGKRRNRFFSYAPYIAMLSEGAEPLSPR